jgi:hypothetical protein
MRLACAALLATVMACAPSLRPTATPPASPPDLAQLWTAPVDVAALDLFHGAGGKDLAPDPAAEYRFLAKDTKGYSDGYDVTGPDGLEWSVKIGPEAQTEVVASRLMWAAGYHQPPTYYLSQWRLASGPEPGIKAPGRFRPKLPWMTKAAEWSWQRNPFVDTQPFRGLIVLNLMINNADLRTPNNVVYDLDAARASERRWYVVRDLGASLGATGFIYGTRNDIAGFERQRFITRVQGARVSFDYHGRHRELLGVLSAADVRWAAERLSMLTEEQWAAAFRAGGYSPDIADRYIRKLRAKIAEGLALPGSASASQHLASLRAAPSLGR